MSGKANGLLGFFILLLFTVYSMIGAIRMILIGLEKANDPIRNIKQKSKWVLVRGIIGLVIFSVVSITLVGILIYGMLYV